MSRDDLAVLGLWCAAVLALLSPVWGRPGFAFFNHGDLYAYHAPIRALTASALQSGRLPFWNPYILLGLPHLANPQSAAFYPVTLLGAILPTTVALVWDQVFHLLWAGAGTFLLARAQRLDRFGALALASAYALSPMLVYRVTEGIPTLLAALAWAPWLWLAWLSGSVLLLAASFALQLLSGHGQFLVINGVGMGLWALARDGRRESLTRLAVAGAGALALTAAQWVPTAEFLRHSVRENWAGALSGAYAMPPGALATWIAPSAFGTPLDGSWPDVPSVFYETCAGWVGPLALALAAWGLVRARRRGPALLLAAAGVFLSLGPRGVLSRAVLGFAVLSYLRTPSRWLFLSVWGVVLLAGAGWRAWKAPPRARAAAAGAGLLVLLAWDAAFLKAQDAAPFLAPREEVAALSAGVPHRVLTDPELANSNKTILYRLMNANGYEAFYPRAVPSWALAAEGAPAADASRVFVTRWRSEAAKEAGVTMRLSRDGVERGDAWPLAAFVDPRGRRVPGDPQLWIESPERWRVTGSVPAGAAALALATPAYPGWRARWNGAAAAVAPWRGIFQALAVAPGTPPGTAFEASLEFRPTGWAWLAALSAAAWAAWLALAARRAEAA